MKTDGDVQRTSPIIRGGRIVSAAAIARLRPDAVGLAMDHNAWAASDKKVATVPATHGSAADSIVPNAPARRRDSKTAAISERLVHTVDAKTTRKSFSSRTKDRSSLITDMAPSLERNF